MQCECHSAILTPCPILLIIQSRCSQPASQPAGHCLDLIDDQSSLIIRSIVKHVNNANSCLQILYQFGLLFLFFFHNLFLLVLCPVTIVSLCKVKRMIIVKPDAVNMVPWINRREIKKKRKLKNPWRMKNKRWRWRMKLKNEEGIHQMKTTMHMHTEHWSK